MYFCGAIRCLLQQTKQINSVKIMETEIKNYITKIIQWLKKNEMKIRSNDTSHQYAIKALTYFRMDTFVKKDPAYKEILQFDPSLFDPVFLAVAQSSLIYDELFSQKFILSLSSILNESKRGGLINLTQIYLLYGKPFNLSPRRQLNQKNFKNLIEDEITKKSFMVESVIQFFSCGIHVNEPVAKFYLQKIDPLNFKSYQILMNSFPDNQTIEMFHTILEAKG